MSTTEPITYYGTASTTCTCVLCTNCLYGSFQELGEACDNCGERTLEARDYCDADCWESAAEDFVNLLTLWATDHGHDNYYIKGTSLGWQRLSGNSVSTGEPRRLFDMCGLNDDYTLRFTYDVTNGTFTIVRTSHDEMGARLEMLPTPRETA